MKKKIILYRGVEVSQSAADVSMLLDSPNKSLIYHARDGEYHLKGGVFPLNIIVSVTGPTRDGQKTEIINCGTSMMRKLSSIVTEFRKRNNTGFSNRYIYTTLEENKHK